MKNKYIWLILVVCLLPNLSFSQVAGYLGKRVHIGLEGRTFPNIFSPQTNALYQNFTKGITANYVLTNKFSIGVSYLNTKLSWADDNLRDYVYQDRYYGNNVAMYKTISPILISSNTLEVSFKRFFKEMAPLGNYIGMRLAYNSTDAENNNLKMYLSSVFPPRQSNTTAIAPESILIPTEKQHSMLFGVELGKTRVIMDRFVLDIGVLLGANFTLIKDPIPISRLDITAEETLANFNDNLAKRVNRHNYIQFKAGVSYLIY
jgi:hypothetical protein